MKHSLLLLIFTFQFLSGNAQNYMLHSNIPYDNISGVSPDLLSLDVYEPLDVTDPRPVIIYVHGGSWKGGTKLNVGYKADLFTEHGYVFVSVNYRLSPDPPDTSSLLVGAVRFPIHPIDVAKAISIVYQQIHLFNGDNQNMHLIGHSAGAHLINLVSTNENFLDAHMLSPAGIGCVCSLDAGVFDLPLEIQIADESRRLMLLSAFGTDSTLWGAASPLFNIETEEDIPNFLLIHQGTPLRIWKTEGFRDSLLALGHSAMTFNAFPYSHSSINTGLGAPEDSIGMTDLVIDFFADCSSGVSASKFDKGFQYFQDILVFPNPSSGVIHFEEDKITSITVVNIFGQALLSKPVLEKKVDLSHLPKGIYVLKAFSGKEVLGEGKVALN